MAKNNLSPFLSPREVKTWPVGSPPCRNHSYKTPLKQAMEATGLQSPLQVAGNHFSIGCVALEITQRCNLDCTACYLSDFSELVRDLPLHEILRRIDQIAEHYGPHTNIQITGGDPTLRQREELIEIVRYAASKDLRPALFTNGIKATRDLLIDLKAAGLKDVAFHVDMTQERKGFQDEKALNQIRSDYIDRAKGLGLQILFNTTIVESNVDDVSMLVDFFCQNAKDVHLASFQMIADTGRGTERNRSQKITQESLMNRIREGAGVDFNFDFPQIGHLECNRYAKCLVAGDIRVSAISEKDRHFFETLLPFTKTLFLSRHRPLRSLFYLIRKLFNGHLPVLLQLTAYGARKAWALRKGLWKSRRRPDLITFYIHNFMHAEALDRTRCEACVFMTMTRDGPISMCVHNAKRDAFILQEVTDNEGEAWSPVGSKTPKDLNHVPIKHLKGRLRSDRAHQQIKGNIGAMASKRRASV